jgi:hypothetical protein
MAQKQIAPTTTMIRTPIRTEMIAMSYPWTLPLPGQHPEAAAGRQAQAALVSLNCDYSGAPAGWLVPSVIDQRADKLQQRLVFWAFGTFSEEFTDIRVGDLSARANVWLVFHDWQLRRRVACQPPSVAIAALVQKSFAHTSLIEIAPRGSWLAIATPCWSEPAGRGRRWDRPKPLNSGRPDHGRGKAISNFLSLCLACCCSLWCSFPTSFGGYGAQVRHDHRR